jgi:integrase
MRIRWGFTDRNPISGPNKGAGVRQSSKRQRIPDILEVEEIQRMLDRLQLRERVLVFLAMATGLRQGGTSRAAMERHWFWEAISWCQQVGGLSGRGQVQDRGIEKPVPLDSYTAEDLLTWYRLTPYRNPEDWVFASDNARAGKKRGKQPLWLQTVVKELGISKRVSWHTFRRTHSTLLKANGEGVKVVQELLRYASVRITMDVYAQAMTPAKSAAQQKVVEMVRAEKSVLGAKRWLNCSPKSSSAKTGVIR